MSKVKSFQIERNRLGKKIGCIAGSPEDYLYKHTVIGYIDGEIPIFIRTNLNQKQWEKFCNNELSREELLKFT